MRFYLAFSDFGVYNKGIESLFASKTVYAGFFFMYANYHTHTYLCHHASGTPEEYIQEAIKNGLSVLGFSDHVPQAFAEYRSGIRMGLEETASYVALLTALREKYRDKIKLYIGYEAEFYPKVWEKTLSHIKKHGCDFLILGQHFTGNEYDGLYVAKNDCDGDLLRQYVSQSIAALETGVFSAVAHPDVIRYAGDRELYRSEMTRLCEAARELSVPMEFNLHGFYMKRHYPSELFWEIAAKAGCSAIIGCDAHDARFVGEPTLYESGVRFLRKCGITPLRELTLRRV